MTGEEMDPKLVLMMNMEAERSSVVSGSDSTRLDMVGAPLDATVQEPHIMATAAAFLRDPPDWEEAAEAHSESDSDSDCEFVPELHRVPNHELEGRGKRPKRASVKFRA